MQLLLCYDNEGVYVNTYGRVSKTMVLQWGEMPTSVAYIGTGQIMGWGNKAIEIRSVESGHLDGVFMHKKAQRLKFLCERNDKVNKVFRKYILYLVAIILQFQYSSHFPDHQYLRASIEIRGWCQSLFEDLKKFNHFKRIESVLRWIAKHSNDLRHFRGF